jgi:malonyl-CoA decarboxylase
MLLDDLKKKAVSVAALATRANAQRQLIVACRKLLSEEGEISGATRALQTLALFAALDGAQRLQWFDTLKREFAPDPARVLAAAHAYALEPSSGNLDRLTREAEPPRQELLRRLNRAPGGTRAIVTMREKLLEALRKDDELKQVDADFRHLLSSWFNPGFLQMVRVDWNSPATLLEQVIQYEAVHEVRGWNDLRRRLQSDRRCFAFFHPAMPREPLIFVEVALVDTMAARIGPLLDTEAVTGDADRFKTAVFYSISNCQPGLRGVSLGNFLIKQVVDQLSLEFPRVNMFCTLSPIPGFRDWLKQNMANKFAAFTTTPSDKIKRAIRSIMGSALSELMAASATDLRSRQALINELEKPLTCLVAAYLTGMAEKNTSIDPVARFHLNNGAKLDRLNWAADESDKGLRQSLGMMVNYVYEPRQIESNHEKFVRGVTVISKQVQALL